MSAKPLRFLAAGPFGGWCTACHIGRQNRLAPKARVPRLAIFPFYLSKLMPGASLGSSAA